MAAIEDLLDDIESQLVMDTEADSEMSIVERRKRLHHLADEINGWIDEPCKNLIDAPTPPPPPPAPPLTFDMYNRPSYRSPKPFSDSNKKSPLRVTIRQPSPSLSINKENQSPSKLARTQTTPSNNEILSVAHRILNKKQSNSAQTTTTSTRANNSNANSIVKDIKSKFERKSEPDAPVEMTPKLIIKKFEALLGKEQKPVNSIRQRTPSNPPAGNHINLKPTDLKAIKLTPVNLSEQSKSNCKNACNMSINENVTPKSIIEKFEKLTKTGESGSNKATKETPLVLRDSRSNLIYSGASTLTFVSSLASDGSPTQPQLPPEQFRESPTPNYNDRAEENEEYKKGEDEDGEDLNEAGNDCDDDGETSLFDESETEPTATTQPTDTYSLSSSFTGSIINQDFDDLDEADDFTSSGIYSGFDPKAKSSTILKESARSFECPSIATSAATTTTTTTSSYVTSEAEPVQQQQQPALFSIQEYRRQKKLGHSVSRRSSVMRANNKARPEASNDESSLSVNDEASKRVKYLERVKELEELIKQEDNVIHQTGIALERCLTDTYFTGSSEHIECNRIILISCQKRQAFLTEINRLKQLLGALNPNLASSANKKPVRVDSIRSESESVISADEISASDLTGLLIFSDVQLPIKESYLNRLKSGEEKRIFYFLCLIRNGIQVLQTQVISVLELLSARDTSVTFPNRMAISNVDVNFRVKIDVYIMETVPKESKSSKPVSTTSNSKFFSPFKSSVFQSHNANNNCYATNSGSSISYPNANNHHYNEHSSLGVQCGGGGAKTSNFIHVDTVEIKKIDISNNRFKLNISSSSIPLTGVLFVNVRCMPSKSIELKGFMTLLEDVNGFRSWERRWCFLNNYNISYWKYPEDEYRNNPIGIISLTKCLNERVAILPRDICARKYTIELSVNEAEGLNEAEASNEASKITKRFRLSADTKDQASDWLTNINYALANLKLWNPKTIKNNNKMK